MFVIPPKLKAGDQLRIIAPASSLAIIPTRIIKRAVARLEQLGLKVSFSKNSREENQFNSSGVQSRVEDLHSAFLDQEIKAIIAAEGGYNSNQLLRYLDWKIIKKNPKIFCGYSDMTVLANTILKKSGLITYSGPDLSTMGTSLRYDYAASYFRQCLFDLRAYEIKSSKSWFDIWLGKSWPNPKTSYRRQRNSGWWVINKGKARGTIIGGNLDSFNILNGTEFMPNAKQIILFLEDNWESTSKIFDRDLQTTIIQPFFKNVEGIVLGRFQKASQITKNLLIKIIKSKKELNSIPILANVDFGHTDPIITFPIGGTALLHIGGGKNSLKIIRH